MNKVVVWLALVLSITSIVITQITKPKNGFIDIGQVYEKFELKKDLAKKFAIVRDNRKKETDSLELSLKLLEAKLRNQKNISDAEAASFQMQRDVYIEKAKRFEEDNRLLTTQYDKEILDQLNQYVNDFGAENKYDYIFGNDNNGSLMHANNKHDVTEEVIKYINEKYKGLK